MTSSQKGAITVYIVLFKQYIGTLREIPRYSRVLTSHIYFCTTCPVYFQQLRGDVMWIFRYLCRESLDQQQVISCYGFRLTEQRCIT